MATDPITRIISDALSAGMANLAYGIGNRITVFVAPSTLVCGPCWSGKTTLFSYLVGRDIPGDHYFRTIEATRKILVYRALNEGSHVKLKNIWDIPGEWSSKLAREIADIDPSVLALVLEGEAIAKSGVDGAPTVGELTGERSDEDAQDHIESASRIFQEIDNAIVHATSTSKKLRLRAIFIFINKLDRWENLADKNSMERQLFIAMKKNEALKAAMATGEILYMIRPTCFREMDRPETRKALKDFADLSSKLSTEKVGEILGSVKELSLKLASDSLVAIQDKGKEFLRITSKNVDYSQDMLSLLREKGQKLLEKKEK